MLEAIENGTLKGRRYMASNNGRPKPSEEVLQRFKARCGFCKSENVSSETLTCNDCGTAMAMNFGGYQRRSHGRKIPGVRQ
jgi:hypothetical protein